MVATMHPIPFICYGCVAIQLLLPGKSIAGQSPKHAPATQDHLPDAPSHVRGTSTARTDGYENTQRSPQAPDASWPREADRGSERVLMYQPQLDSWPGDKVSAYAALAVVSKSDKKTRYGVVRFTARTEVDKVNRQVTLYNFQITKVEFPTMKSREAEYQAFLQAKLPGKSKVIALDRLEAALQASESAESRIKTFSVNNDPPRVIFSTKTAMLLLVDGAARFRDVGGTDLELLLNTKSTVILDRKNSKYYLSVMDGWMEAPRLDGPWAYASKIPDDMKEISKGIQERQRETARERAAQPSLKQAAKDGKVPAVFVSFGPAELLVTEGPPQLETIPGLALEYVKNTSANIFRDLLTNDYYILLAGRWFKSTSLENGPWQFVGGKGLPESFAHVPEDSPKAGVLASVPGTGPAKEALIANSIPQTATISRGETHIEVQYDGGPQFKQIEGTELQYAVNTATPVIRVADKNYYAVENAVWFVGPSPRGPWAVATAVPDVIYTIPPEAPLHYVTYVKVYESTPEVVHVGYTPGYYGSVVSSSTTTVVYGTGWYYPPYIGTYWYGAPYTYGVGVATTWSLGEGWSLTFGVGYGYSYGYPYYAYPWWGPWGYYACCWVPAWGYGWGGYASANVYGRWGNSAYAGTRAAWANPYTANYGAASRAAFQNTQRGTRGIAGRGTNTNIYTGNTFSGRGAIGYNPNTGIAAGAGAGYVGNTYSGQGSAGRGGFAYNTNTGTGIAIGNNNVYAGKNGTVYRYDRQNSSWAQNSGKGWQPADRSQELQQQQRARSMGQMRMQNFSSMGGMRGGRRR
jgi:hypothetical protein